MNRRGFALLAVLWVVAALTAIVGLGVGESKIGSFGSTNRQRLERARWGAEACLAIAEARWVDHRLVDSATIDLGRTTSCHWEVDDPTAQLNVNTVPAAILTAAGFSTARAAYLVAGRPYQDTAEIRAALGPDTALLPLLTVDGPGTVDVNAASRAVVLSLPGLGAEAAQELAEFKRIGRPISSLDQLVSVTSGARADVMAHYADLSALVTFAPPQWVITATGQVGDETLHATVEETVVPLPDRLAVIRKRLW